MKVYLVQNFSGETGTAVMLQGKCRSMVHAMRRMAAILAARKDGWGLV